MITSEYDQLQVMDILLLGESIFHPIIGSFFYIPFPTMTNTDELIIQSFTLPNRLIRVF